MCDRAAGQFARTIVHCIAGTALVLGGCRDGTGPGGVEVDVSIASQADPVIRTPVDGVIIRCDINLRADVRGLQKAQWGNAIARFAWGVDRTTPTDSIIIPAAEVVDTWGGDSITPGVTRHSQWWFSAGAPFTLTLEFRYVSRSGSGSARIAFDCGPSPDEAAQPPTVTSASVHPTDGTLDIGDSITVTYSATAEMGLWASSIQIAGPCELQREFADALLTTLSRTVHIAIPPECREGLLPISVFVVAWDALLRPHVRQVDTQVLVIDGSPPMLTASLVGEAYGVKYSPMSGHAFVGSRINLALTATDNAALDALYWEVWPAGFRDSLKVSGPYLTHAPSLEVPPEWVGPAELRAYARDAQGLVSDTVRSVEDGLHIHPTLAVPTREGESIGQSGRLAVDVARNALYLLASHGQWIAVHSLNTLAWERTIALPSRAGSVDVSAGGDSLLLSLDYDRALGVIDLRDAEPSLSLLPLTALPVPTTHVPGVVRAMANGKVLIALRPTQPTQTPVYEVDLVTGAHRLREDAGVPGGYALGAFEISRDRSSAALAFGETRCLRRYDAATDTFSACVTPATPVEQLRLDATGDRVLAGRDLYDGALTYLRRVETPSAAVQPVSELSPDGSHIYQLVPNIGVVRVDAADGRIIDRIEVARTPTRLRISADGRALVTVDWKGDSYITRLELP